MQQPGAVAQRGGQRRGVGRAVFGVVFLLVFVFSYSEEIVSGLFEAFGREESDAWRAVVLGVDLAVLGLTGVLESMIGRADGRPGRLWRWWASGCAMVLTVNLLLDALDDDSPVWVDLLASTVFVIAMAILMMSSLNADPLTLFNSEKRSVLALDWLRVRAVVPLIIGTFAAYIGATVWTDYFNIDVIRTPDAELEEAVEELSIADQQDVLNQLCVGGIAPRYFEHVAEVIPLLLLTLGIEFGFFRRTLQDAAQRAATAVTVILMSAGLVLALSTLPWIGTGCGEVLSAWHEYLGFVVTLQAVFTGLATLVWLLVVNIPEGEPAPEQETSTEAEN